MEKIMDWTQDIRNYYLPMNAKTAAEEDLPKYSGPDWICEEKLDGMRCVLYFGHPKFHNDRVRAFSRSISVTNNLPVEITAKIPQIIRSSYSTLPFVASPFILDTEIVHELGFGPSREIMGSPVTRAIAMQHGKPIKNDGLFLMAEGRAYEKMLKEREKTNRPIPERVVFFTNDKMKLECAPFYGPVYAVAFDALYVLRVGERNLLQSPLAERLQALKEVLYKNNLPQIRQNKTVVACKAEQFYSEVIARGGEGIMYKNLNGLYIPDYRTGDWRKRKKEATFDVVIMGYEDPEVSSVKKGDVEATPTKFHLNGWIGAIVFGVHDGTRWVEVGKASGMDDYTRQLLSENKNKYLFQVIEVEAHAMNENTYKLSHPRFTRFRPDKRTEECTLAAHKAAGEGKMRK